MTHLNIQQGQNVEVVSTNLIKKLYEAALSVPEPLEGEQDDAYMSGNLQVDKTYRTQVSYLTTRFPDLHINVTGSYYIPFEDSNVQSVLMANNISSDGIGITEGDASTANLGTMFKDNTTITSFNEFGYFTKANNQPSGEMFKGCTNLSSIDQSNITKLANRQFYGTGLTTVNMPNLQSLDGAEQFYDCDSLTNVQSLGDILSLSNTMFRNCSNLTSVTLPSNILQIPVQCFAYDSSLSTINLQNISAVYDNGLRQTSLANVSIGDLQNLTTIGEFAFLQTQISGVLNLPNLTQIGSQAFDRCSRLTGIECLGKISNIPTSGVFNQTPITYAKIPYECTSIGNGAFNNCTNLTTIKQYNKSLSDYSEGESPVFTNISRVTTFGKRCFYGCSSLVLSDVDFSNVISIDNEAFSGCRSITINTLDLTNATTINYAAFMECNINSIIWSSSVTTVPTYCFSMCGIQHISNLDNVTILSGRCLQGCSLQQALYLKNVTTTNYYGNDIANGDNGTTFTGDYINGSAFALYMPKTVDVYGGYYDNTFYSSGFFGSRGTTTIPVVYFKDLQEVYPCSFGSLQCTSLIINNTTPPTWYNSLKKTDQEATNPSRRKNLVFPDNCNITNIYVPDSALTTYTSDADWSTLIAKGVTFKSMNELQQENLQME